MGRQTKPIAARKITRTVSFDPALVEEIEEYARETTDSNFSKAIVAMVRDFFERLRGEKKAA